MRIRKVSQIIGVAQTDISAGEWVSRAQYCVRQFRARLCNHRRSDAAPGFGIRRTRRF
ncbi:hypothetical protein [Bradyrhizobium sp. 150]|uniref:hypothetical protein n=1 Tax=Bradyrhizobium sp. 150 TaxID=2782625 RepID=UPI001FF9BAA2|nr:hypothetical protein [Bradyrhizobium sp. 150]